MVVRFEVLTTMTMKIATSYADRQEVAHSFEMFVYQD